MKKVSDKSSLKTKTDVLDLIIGFIMEHEKRMDEIVERLEKLSDRMSREDRRRDTKVTMEPNLRKPRVFSLSINNPEGYEKIKSIRIDWETEEKEYTPELSEIDAILDKIDFTFRDEDRHDHLLP
ncbi:MAG TPA: hypothetical protein VM050_07445 [Patescibacteria group bacterium]|nr:hypothetical protein [Patescibacteria group bacterium]